MMLALLLSAWMWDRVLTDCLGSPETVTHYYLQATARFQTLEVCLDDDGVPFPCTKMLPGDPVRFTGNIPDPGTGTTVTTTYDPVANPDMLPTPPLGGVVGWPWFSPESMPVVAVDAAGNDGRLCP